MTKKEFDKLTKRDFENGAWLDEIRSSLDWEKQARAAGWSPPVQSKLRVVEKCPNHMPDTDVWDKENTVWVIECPICQNKTITRPLTQEELVEVEERCFKSERYLATHILKVIGPNKNPDQFTLSSGARVIMEDNDEKR